MIEITHQFDPEKARRPPSDVGVAGEIRVDLHGKGEHSCPKDRKGWLIKREDFVGQESRVVRHDDLLKKSPQHQAERAAPVDGIESAIAMVLRQHVRGALDWPGHELWKEGNVKCVVEEVPFGFHAADIYVDDIPD